MLENISEEKAETPVEVDEEPKSADEIDEHDLLPQEDSVIKIKKPRSEKQMEALKKAQETRRKNMELKKAEKVVKAQQKIEELKPEPTQTRPEMELVKEMMQMMNPRRGRGRRDDSSTDSEDSVERLERKIAKKKAQRARLVPQAASLPVKSETKPKKKLLSFN